MAKFVPLDPEVKKARRAAKEAKRAERLALVQASRALTYVQRLTIEALLHSLTQRDAIAKLQAAGLDVDTKHVTRWLRQANFIEALQTRSTQIAAELTKDSVLVNAKKILEEALTPKPILHKGEDTGFREIELGTALNANEQIGKALGAFNKDESGKQIVVLDIDFSGRKQILKEYVGGEEVIEGEFAEVPLGPPTPPPAEAVERMKALADGLTENPSWLD